MSTKAYRESLMKALNYEPQNWVWDKTCIDRGQGNLTSCACGHSIRYEFPLIHQNSHKQIIVGCVCVEQYHLFDESTINEMKAKIEEAKRIEKEAQQNEEIKILTIQKEEIDLKIINFEIALREKLQRYFLPYEIWHFIHRERKIKEVSKYKKLGSYINALKKYIQISNEWLENNKNRLTEKEKENYGFSWIANESNIGMICKKCNKEITIQDVKNGDVKLHYHYNSDGKDLEHVNCEEKELYI